MKLPLLLVLTSALLLTSTVAKRPTRNAIVPVALRAWTMDDIPDPIWLWSGDKAAHKIIAVYPNGVVLGDYGFVTYLTLRTDFEWSETIGSWRQKCEVVDPNH